MILKYYGFTNIDRHLQDCAALSKQPTPWPNRVAGQVPLLEQKCRTLYKRPTGKALQVNCHFVKMRILLKTLDNIKILLVTQPMATWYTRNQLCSQKEDIYFYLSKHAICAVIIRCTKYFTAAIFRDNFLTRFILRPDITQDWSISQTKISLIHHLNRKIITCMDSQYAK